MTIPRSSRALCLSLALTVPLAAGESPIRFGAVSPASPVLTSSKTYGAMVAAGDFDNDGKLDAAIAWGSNAIALLRGNGDGTFQTPLIQPTGGTAANVNVIAAADMNHDGQVDLIVGDYTAGNVTVLAGTGQGTFIVQAAATGKSGIFDLQIGDFNRDGNNDVVVAENSYVGIFLGNGSGGLTPVANPPGIPLDGAANVRVADFDHDGKPDVAVAYSADVYTMRGNGDGTFQPFQKVFSVVPKANAGLLALATGDVNHDGATDLIVQNLDGSTVTVLLNQGAGTFTQETSFPAPLPAGVGGVIVGNLNRDALPDLITIHGSTAVFYRGRADGTFPFSSSCAAPSGSARRGQLGDFDGDGRPDLALAYPFGSVGILLNITGKTDTIFNKPTETTTITAGGSLEITVSVVPHNQDAFSSGLEGGTVVFRDNGAVFATLPMNLAGTKTTFQSSVLGDHKITASYSGDGAEWDPSVSSPLTIHVTAATPTTTAISGASQPIPFGTPSINISASVTSRDATVATGVVRFTSEVGVQDVPLINGNATAAINTSALNAGLHDINAFYLGDATHDASTAIAALTIAKATIAMTLAITPDGGAYRIAVNGNFTTASGTLTLFVANIPVETQDVSGPRVFRRSLTPGVQYLWVRYSGDSNHEVSLSPQNVPFFVPAALGKQRGVRH